MRKGGFIMKLNSLNWTIFILFVCIIVSGFLSVYVIRNANADAYGKILSEEYLSRCVTKEETAIAIADAAFKSIKNTDKEFTFDAHYNESSKLWQIIPNDYPFCKNYAYSECGIFISSFDGRVVRVNL